MRNQKNPSIRQVAKEAGVSIYTVSSVLNNKGDISDRTRDIVLAAIKKLDYDPLRNIPLARTSRRTSFGIVLPDVASTSDTFYYRSILTANALGTELGYELKIFSQRDFGAAELGFAPEGTRFGCSAFIFFMPGSGWEELALGLLHDGVRVAAVGRTLETDGILCFDIDRALNIRLAMEHLAACGCRSIGLNIYTKEGTRSRGYPSQYRSLVQQLGLTADERLIVTREANRGGDPALPFISMMREGLKVDGIFFTADRFAARANRGFWKAGIKVPDDVMVVGVNDDPIASEIIPALTTVRIPVEAMVAAACQALHEYSPDRVQEKRPVLFEQQLIVRESTVTARNA